jgi:hypothetical protein
MGLKLPAIHGRNKAPLRQGVVMRGLAILRIGPGQVAAAGGAVERKAFAGGEGEAGREGESETGRAHRRVSSETGGAPAPG